VKLLFDQNLSPRLVSRLADEYPGSDHVSSVGLEAASDLEVWEYARDHGYTLVSKDADFSELSLLRGFPPKVLWLRVGNCTTSRIEEVIRHHREALEQLETDDSLGILSLI
jgi:predicted nuclease of predicted toxin-antitoxin system